MTMSADFTDRTVFLTGAGTGIGRATALAFAEAGAQLALVDRDAPAVEETAALVRAKGSDVCAVTADVTDETQVQEAVGTCVERFGRLDVAVNNVGRDQRVAPLADSTLAEWRAAVDVNVTSMFLCMRHEIPVMLSAGGGAIVNTASGAGLIGIRGTALYAAAKHAVIGLTRSAALDYADQNIRVNAVAPGIIETGMMERVSGGTAEGRAQMVSEEPIGRLGHPDEVASAILWLASDGASFAIGSALVVDGGHTIR